MPGSMTSMPYFAVPLVLAGMSSCGTDMPIRAYWSGVFSVIALSSSGVKVLVALPLLTISANVIDFFDFGCEMTESRTTSSFLLKGRHSHCSGRSLRQCDTPAGARAAHGIEIHHRRPTAAGDLRAQHGIVELRIVGGELDPHVL